jgi:ribosomal protein S18 acetylase RimI-like enzyme
MASISSSSAEPSPQHRVRLADPADTDALVGLINEAFAVEKIVIEGDRIDSEKVRALFENGNFLLLFEAEELLGCVYVEVKGKRGYLGLLGVRPNRQKSGLGRGLTAAAEDYFRSAGCEGVDLRIVSVRAELPPFYKRLGYKETGIAPIPESIALKIPSHFIIMSKELA